MVTTSDIKALVPRETTELDRDGLQPQSYDSVSAAAKDLVASGFWRGTFDTPQQALMAILMGRELGLRMVQSANMLTVIRGKVGMYARAKVALVQREGIEIWLSHDPTHPRTPAEERSWAEWTAIKNGREVRSTFSMEEADLAGYLGGDEKSAWRRQPRNMLVWRAASRLCDREFSDILLGLPTAEDLRDESEAEVVTATIEGVSSSSNEALRKIVGLEAAEAMPSAREIIEEARSVALVQDLERSVDAEGQASVDPAPAPAEPKPEREHWTAPLRKELVQTQLRILEIVESKDEATRWWYGEHGPGDVGVGKLKTKEAYEQAIAVAHDLAERLHIYSELVETRHELSDLDAQGGQPLPSHPHADSIATMRQMLESDLTRLEGLRARQ